MTFWYILRAFDTFSGFGIMHLEKSGNPDQYGHWLGKSAKRQRCNGNLSFKTSLWYLFQSGVDQVFHF
jgi:hypothetical protein